MLAKSFTSPRSPLVLADGAEGSVAGVVVPLIVVGGVGQSQYAVAVLFAICVIRLPRGPASEGEVKDALGLVGPLIFTVHLQTVYPDPDWALGGSVGSQGSCNEVDEIVVGGLPVRLSQAYTGSCLAGSRGGLPGQLGRVELVAGLGRG